MKLWIGLLSVDLEFPSSHHHEISNLSAALLSRLPTARELSNWSAAAKAVCYSRLHPHAACGQVVCALLWDPCVDLPMSECNQGDERMFVLVTHLVLRMENGKWVKDEVKETVRETHGRKEGRIKKKAPIMISVLVNRSGCTSAQERRLPLNEHMKECVLYCHWVTRIG